MNSNRNACEKRKKIADTFLARIQFHIIKIWKYYCAVVNTKIVTNLFHVQNKILDSCNFDIKQYITRDIKQTFNVQKPVFIRR